MAVNSINTNIAAYFAQANIGVASDAAAKSVARLSSGNRIISASDDVAALATGTSLRINVATLGVARINASQGSSLVQVADGGLSQITDLLARQKAIALQAGSGSLSDSDRGFLNQEFQALKDEIDRIVGSTNFNGVTLLDGSLSGSNPLRSAANGTATVTGFTSQGTLITAVAFTDAAGTIGDTTFYGDLSEGTFEVQATASTFNITYNINGSTYVGTVATPTATGASVALTNGEGTITFTIAADVTGTYTVDAAGAALFETDLTESFSAATAFANRVVLSTNATSGGSEIEGSAIEAQDTNGTLLDGFTGADVTLRSQHYNGVNLPTIAGFASIGTFGVGTKFSVTINGRSYISEALTDATDIAGTGGAGAIYSGGANNVLRFYQDGDSTTNPQEYLDINLSNVNQVIDVDNQEGVNAFVSVLNQVFGNTGGGLSFQVGVSTSDTIGVSVGDVSTATLYEGATLSVSSQSAASTASTALDVAISTVTSRRADVGALQSRFNFAAANIENSIQNQDAARAGLLDADIAIESTNYANAQVKLQAGIAVLAQANQQLQSLLKLIG